MVATDLVEPRSTMVNEQVSVAYEDQDTHCSSHFHQDRDQEQDDRTRRADHNALQPLHAVEQILKLDPHFSLDRYDLFFQAIDALMSRGYRPLVHVSHLTPEPGQRHMLPWLRQ